MTYQNHTCNCNSKPLNITLVPFDRDEKAVYVDSVLNALLESRFGPEHIYDAYELEFRYVEPGFVNYDLMPLGCECNHFGRSRHTAFSRHSGCTRYSTCSGLGHTSSGSASTHRLNGPGSGLRTDNLSAIFAASQNAIELLPLRRSPSTLARGSPAEASSQLSVT